MCGRITQSRLKAEYRAAIGWPERAVLGSEDDVQALYNVSPGTAPKLMHRLGEDAAESIDYVHWGYRPTWAIEKKIPMAINARIEKAMTGPYFRHMWKSGRAICPADGWYEWTEEDGKKQPWYIRLKVDAPCFLAALTNWKPHKAPPEGTGFVIVTAQAGGGLVDVHDRRPVVLGSADAKLWLDPDLLPEHADSLARELALGPDAFEWYRVGRAVNSVKNNRVELTWPLQEPAAPSRSA